MATDDRQVLVTGTAPAPATFRIPGNGQLRPKTVFATFDGSGAAGAFLPALKIVSDAGELVGIYPTDDSVAAGASADVTWFPRGIGGAAAAATADVQWFFGSRSSAQTITAGNIARIGWTHHVTSDASVFSVTTTGVANDTVNGLKLGTYLAFTNCEWQPFANYPNSVNITTSFFGVSVAVNTPVADSTTSATPVGNTTNVNDAMLCLTQSVPGEISVRARNYDVANHNIVSALYAILYWPNSVAVS